MSEFSDNILIWYGENRRDLPWRNTKDPYLIWISEIILQQTRVSQGYDYYLSFVSRFPDVCSLASAPEDEVMRYWQGLGYYSRARNLHAAAKSMNGTFPTTYEGVRALKGVGDYTAAAICSFAYGMPYAVVDGNVFRVLSRYFGIDTPIDSTTGKKLFTALAQDNLDESCPAEYNQAMMDFGALQCTPQSPTCMYCPLAETCVAFRTGMAEELPVKQKKLSVKTRHFNYLWVKAGEYTYINKRTEKDIWQNLYELPLVESEHELSQIELLERMKPWLTDDEEIQLDLLIQGVKHVLTHRVIMANFYQVTLPPGSSSFSSFIMVKPESLASYAFPRLITSFLNKSH
ncbi:MAG: A/G-specific adenine glycosylase [Bacteroidaceae bacterium]|nr:A/G-specific adenine glycosylase [Bacteroidaceae bacterium]